MTFPSSSLNNSNIGSSGFDERGIGALAGLNAQAAAAAIESYQRNQQTQRLLQQHQLSQQNQQTGGNTGGFGNSSAIATANAMRRLLSSQNAPTHGSANQATSDLHAMLAAAAAGELQPQQQQASGNSSTVQQLAVLQQQLAQASAGSTTQEQQALLAQLSSLARCGGTGSGNSSNSNALSSALAVAQQQHQQQYQQQNQGMSGVVTADLERRMLLQAAELERQLQQTDLYQLQEEMHVREQLRLHQEQQQQLQQQQIRQLAAAAAASGQNAVAMVAAAAADNFSRNNSSAANNGVGNNTAFQEALRQQQLQQLLLQRANLRSPSAVALEQALGIFGGNHDQQQQQQVASQQQEQQNAVASQISAALLARVQGDGSSISNSAAKVGGRQTIQQHVSNSPTDQHQQQNQAEQMMLLNLQQHNKLMRNTNTNDTKTNNAKSQQRRAEFSNDNKTNNNSANIEKADTLVRAVSQAGKHSILNRSSDSSNGTSPVGRVNSLKTNIENLNNNHDLLRQVNVLDKSLTQQQQLKQDSSGGKTPQDASGSDHFSGSCIKASPDISIASFNIGSKKRKQQPGNKVSSKIDLTEVSDSGTRRGGANKYVSVKPNETQINCELSQLQNSLTNKKQKLNWDNVGPMSPKKSAIPHESVECLQKKLLPVLVPQQQHQKPSKNTNSSINFGKVNSLPTKCKTTGQKTTRKKRLSLGTTAAVPQPGVDIEVPSVPCKTLPLLPTNNIKFFNDGMQVDEKGNSMLSQNLPDVVINRNENVSTKQPNSTRNSNKKLKTKQSSHQQGISLPLIPNIPAGSTSNLSYAKFSNSSQNPGFPDATVNSPLSLSQPSRRPVNSNKVNKKSKKGSHAQQQGSLDKGAVSTPIATATTKMNKNKLNKKSSRVASSPNEVVVSSLINDKKTVENEGNSGRLIASSSLVLSKKDSSGTGLPTKQEPAVIPSITSLASNPSITLQQNFCTEAEFLGFVKERVPEMSKTVKAIQKASKKHHQQKGDKNGRVSNTSTNAVTSIIVDATLVELYKIVQGGVADVVLSAGSSEGGSSKENRVSNGVVAQNACETLPERTDQLMRTAYCIRAVEAFKRGALSMNNGPSVIDSPSHPSKSETKVSTDPKKSSFVHATKGDINLLGLNRSIENGNASKYKTCTPLNVGSKPNGKISPKPGPIAVKNISTLSRKRLDKKKPHKLQELEEQQRKAWSFFGKDDPIPNGNLIKNANTAENGTKLLETYTTRKNLKERVREPKKSFRKSFAQPTSNLNKSAKAPLACVSLDAQEDKACKEKAKKTHTHWKKRLSRDTARANCVLDGPHADVMGEIFGGVQSSDTEVALNVSSPSSVKIAVTSNPSIKNVMKGGEKSSTASDDDMDAARALLNFGLK